MTAAGIVISVAVMVAVPTQPRRTAERPPLEAVCGIELPATRLSVTDFPPDRRAAPPAGDRRGVVLDYTTQPNLVGSVRDLLRRYAATQDSGTPVAQHINDAELGRGVTGTPPGTAVLVPGAHASVSDTPVGARLTLAPVTPAMRRLLHAAANRQQRARSFRPCPPDVRLNPAPASPRSFGDSP